MLPEKAPNEYVPTWKPKPAVLVLRGAKRDEDHRRVQHPPTTPARPGSGSLPWQASTAQITELPLDVQHHIFSDLQDTALSTLSKYRDGTWDRPSDPERDLAVRRVRARLPCVLRAGNPAALPNLLLIWSTRSRETHALRLAFVAFKCLSGTGPRNMPMTLHDTRTLRSQSCTSMRARVTTSWMPSCGPAWGKISKPTERTSSSEALDSCARLRDAWESYVSAVAQGQEALVSLTEYQKMLLEGHAKFRRLHQEQDRLIRDGMFANILASALTRFPNARSLYFIDTWETGPSFDSAELLLDNEMISRIILAPLIWRDIEDETRGPAEMQCVRLLWEVPVVLHKAGIQLKEMNVGVIPLCLNFSLLCLTDQAGAPTWEDLRDACEPRGMQDYC
ncbi:hypothetical protein VTI74DRAFT_7436 [Chaetomium olivicolor]